MKKNIPFDSLTGDMRHKRHIIHEACRKFNRAPSPGNLKHLLSMFGECGDKVIIESGFHCDYGDKIFLGERVYINSNCTLLDGGKITVGDDSLIGPNVQILTINHPIAPEERLAKTNLASDVIIENNVWIGAGAIILPGNRIGQGSIIGAGAVVTKDVSANSMAVGNPAKIIKHPL